jgi:hypothetical protein
VALQRLNVRAHSVASLPQRDLVLLLLLLFFSSVGRALVLGRAFVGDIALLGGGRV